MTRTGQTRPTGPTGPTSPKSGLCGEKFLSGVIGWGIGGCGDFGGFGLNFGEKSCENIWWWRKKCIPLHSLSGSKRASEERGQAGDGASEAAEQLTRGTTLALTETPERERRKKKLKKNLEVADFLLTFAKFFRLTKTAGLRTTGSGAGKSPRTLKDLQ